MIEKENTKTSLSSLENPCEDVLVEKSMFGAEPDIDINVSSIENTIECLTNKEEASFMTPPESIVYRPGSRKWWRGIELSYRRAKRDTWLAEGKEVGGLV